jgi:UrcA family protein
VRPGGLSKISGAGTKDRLHPSICKLCVAPNNRGRQDMLARTLAAIGASALLLATPALAQEDLMSVEVRTGDLNLASNAGRAQLNRRIFRAMGQICGEAPRSLDIAEAYDSCRTEVLADADAKIAALKGPTVRITLARRAR